MMKFLAQTGYYIEDRLILGAQEVSLTFATLALVFLSKTTSRLVEAVNELTV